MFAWKPSAKETGLKKARDEALVELKCYEAIDPRYQKIMVHVKTLTELIRLEKRERLSPNTMALVAGNAITALLVVGYESKNVVTSKAQSFMLKFKS